jgi:hypothetical protein
MFDRVKIGICIPTAGFIRAETFSSFYKVIRLLNEKKLWPEAKEQSHVLLVQVGSGISTNREGMVKRAIEAECTHVLFIDDDMIFDGKAFELLARRRQPIVGCNYRRRLPPADFTALHLAEPRGSKGWVKTEKESTGLEPVDFMGFGLSLIETRVFKETPTPWFLNAYKDGTYTTEDLPFFFHAREAGFIAYVDQDASKYIGHIGSCDYRWHTEYPVPPVVIERSDYEKLKEQDK